MYFTECDNIQNDKLKRRWLLHQVNIFGNYGDIFTKHKITSIIHYLYLSFISRYYQHTKSTDIQRHNDGLADVHESFSFDTFRIE